MNRRVEPALEAPDGWRSLAAEQLSMHYLFVSPAFLRIWACLLSTCGPLLRATCDFLYGPRWRLRTGRPQAFRADQALRPSPLNSIRNIP
jgi:hypothetical protein